MEENTVHQGGCLCGAVRVEVRGTPKRVGACHCRYCQLRSGSAFGVSVYFPHEDVTVLQGELKSYAYQTESGNTTENQFCTECGSNVLWKVGALPDYTGTAGGSYDPPTFWYEIQREVFQRSSADFVNLEAPESHATIPYYDPQVPEDGRLKGG